MNLAAHAIHKDVVLDSVEKLRKINIDAELMALPDDLLNPLRGSITCSIKSASGETLRDGVSMNAGSVNSWRSKFAGRVGSISFPKSNVCCEAPRSEAVGRS